MEKQIREHLAISSYLKEHPDYYDEYEQEFIRSYSLHTKRKNKYAQEVIREIYDELGMIPDDQNIYLAFLDLIDKQFGINGKNILEVGGGAIPSLAKKIHLKQSKGTITVYDPRIGKDIHGEERFVLRRDKFTRDTDIEDTNLIIGLMPCQAAEVLITQATKNDIDFMLWLCEGGPHGDYYDFYESDDEWLGSMLYLAQRGVEDQEMGKLRIKNMPEFSQYPIIYNQRNK